MTWEGIIDRWQVLLHRAPVSSGESTFFTFMDVGYIVFHPLPSTVVATGVIDVFAFEFALTKERDDTSCGQRFLQTETRNMKHET